MPTIKLRQDTARSLPYVGSENSQCIYWDESFNGFGLRVYPSQRRAYVYSYRVDRRKRLAMLGRADVLTLDQARRKARVGFGMVAGDEDPQAHSDAKHASCSIKTLADSFVENHCKRKKTTWKGDESCLRRLLIPKHGVRLATTLSTADIERIHSSKGVKHPHAANRFIEIVRKMFNWGRTAGMVPKEHHNPVVGIVRYPERKRKRYVTSAEMPRLIRAIEAEDNEFARHAIWLLLLMGVRRGELLKAKWADIDWDLHTLFIGLTKNGEPVLAPLSEAAIARLRRIPRLKNNPHVICGTIPGKHLTNLHCAWVRVRTAADITDVRLHDLRRTVGSWLVHSGASLHLVGQVLNHKDTKTTAGYAYFQTQHREQALTAHGERILKLAGLSGELSENRAHPCPELAAILAQSPTSSIPTFRNACYIDRQELYKLVWTAPVSEIASRFGISDVGLAKVCRRALIPIPGRGYWAKVESGRLIKPDPLPSPPPELLGKLRIRGKQLRVVAPALAA
jgi:site-specific recombinase XerD